MSGWDFDASDALESEKKEKKKKKKKNVDEQDIDFGTGELGNPYVVDSHTERSNTGFNLFGNGGMDFSRKKANPYSSSQPSNPIFGHLNGQNSKSKVIKNGINNFQREQYRNPNGFQNYPLGKRNEQKKSRFGNFSKIDTSSVQRKLQGNKGRKRKREEFIEPKQSQDEIKDMLSKSKKRRKQPLNVGVFWDSENINFFDIRANFEKHLRRNRGGDKISLGEKQRFVLARLSNFIGNLGNVDKAKVYYDITKRTKILEFLKKSKNYGFNVCNVATWDELGTLKESVDKKIMLDMTFWATKQLNRSMTIKESDFKGIVVLISMDADYSFLLSRLKNLGFLTYVIGVQGRFCKLDLINSCHKFVTFEENVLNTQMKKQ